MLSDAMAIAAPEGIAKLVIANDEVAKTKDFRPRLFCFIQKFPPAKMLLLLKLETQNHSVKQ